MACGGCGKRSSAYKKVQSPPTPGNPPPVPRLVSRAAPPPIPRSISSGSAHGVQSGTTVAQRESDQVCPICMGKLWKQMKYIDRLRRYFDVLWCPTCKKGPE